MLAENSPTVQGDVNEFTWWCTHKMLCYPRLMKYLKSVISSAQNKKQTDIGSFAKWLKLKKKVLHAEDELFARC